MPTPIRGQSITAPPKVDATLSNTSSNTVQNQAVANALAGAYDATATYAVGDICIYDGILYECTTAIATAEAWDATHWKTSNFGDAVSGLNRQLSDKPDINLGITGATVGKYARVKTVDANGKPTEWDYGSGGGGSGTDDYTELSNKPQINSVTLTGNKSLSDIGAIAAPSSPATGAFLVWDGTAWVAQTLATWQGGSY